MACEGKSHETADRSNADQISLRSRSLRPRANPAGLGGQLEHLVCILCLHYPEIGRSQDVNQCLADQELILNEENHRLVEDPTGGFILRERTLADTVLAELRPKASLTRDTSPSRST